MFKPHRSMDAAIAVALAEVGAFPDACAPSMEELVALASTCSMGTKDVNAIRIALVDLIEDGVLEVTLIDKPRIPMDVFAVAFVKQAPFIEARFIPFGSVCLEKDSQMPLMRIHPTTETDWEVSFVDARGCLKDIAVGTRVQPLRKAEFFRDVAQAERIEAARQALLAKS